MSSALVLESRNKVFSPCSGPCGLSARSTIAESNTALSFLVGLIALSATTFRSTYGCGCVIHFIALPSSA
jgi:hypothetical protein